MAQQTTIDWLLEEWPALKYQLPTWLIEQAKAMEKNQISKAWDAGKHQYFSMGIPEIEFNNGDEYYNINYNEAYRKD